MTNTVCRTSYPLLGLQTLHQRTPGITLLSIHRLDEGHAKLFGTMSSRQRDLKRKRRAVPDIPELQLEPSVKEFERWETAVVAHLKFQGLWEIVSDQSPCPSNPYEGVKDITAAVSAEDNKDTIEAYHKYREWIHSDVEAADIILAGVDNFKYPSGYGQNSTYRHSKLVSSGSLYDAILAEYKPGSTSQATRMDRYMKWIETKYTHNEDDHDYDRYCVENWQLSLKRALESGCDISEELQVYALIETFKGRFPTWAHTLRCRMRETAQPLGMDVCTGLLRASFEVRDDTPKGDGTPDSPLGGSSPAYSYSPPAYNPISPAYPPIGPVAPLSPCPAYANSSDYM